MNEKFYRLPAEKQQKILNAGFQVFSENSYKKSPVSEIAEAAGISKSLLFFYFRNKKELYLFLWEKAAEITMEYLTEYKCYEPGDLFLMMERGMAAKFHIMEKYPYIAQFAIKAFYEKDENISEEIHKSYQRWFDSKAVNTLATLNPDDFVPGLDLAMMYQEMYWASAGYLWEMLQRGTLNVPQMERDFERLLAFWKSIYLRKESEHDCTDA
ncbi:MAG: TetR/AcrR family transcriptional regulator [Oscillospiraceae bacterium]